MKFGRVLLIGFVLMRSSELTAAQPRTGASHDAQPANHAGTTPVSLDIPSQSLELALKAFSDATHVTLFYESNVISGRRSFGLRGAYPADVALRLMLQGTGLSSTSFERGTITILPPQSDEASDIQRAKAGVLEFSRYLALVQKSLDLAFCQGAVVANEPDEMLARLWMAPSGEVLRADLLSSTGTGRADRIYLAMLAALAVDARPPAAMPQPINLMIMPKKSRQSATCMTRGTASGPAAHE